MKTGIVEELGEAGLLLPALLDKALKANDRAKLRMTALQEAVAHARTPLRPPRSLEAECRAAGCADQGLDLAISGARAMEGGTFAVPGAAQLVDGIFDDIAAMAEPLRAAGRAEAPAFEGRLEAVRGALKGVAGDVIDEGALVRVTSARRGGADSAHLLVMDLHKALNQLSATVAVENVAGAHALNLQPVDRPRVEAFMRGLDRTRGLAFGHPGLDTTASRSGERLIVQNDIGTTDAHVLILTVDGLSATLTYTDVHRARAKFFISLFSAWDVDWTPLAERSAEGLGDEGHFLLVTGTYRARDEMDLCGFLEGMGARIVFLIDWNKARKALQTFVDKPSAIRLLRAAALDGHGHRAFLELGGADLVFDAVQRSAEGRVPYGARLDRVLGAAAAANLLGEVLRLTSEGLKAHRSVRLIRDEVRAELALCFGSAEKDILAIALRQLGIARMLASLITEALAGTDVAAEAARIAIGERAKRLEEKADRLVVAARDLASGPFARGRRFMPVVEAVEQANDDFEEAAFLLSIAPAAAGSAVWAPLAELAGIAVVCTSDLVRAVAAAWDGAGGQREDITAALETIEAVVEGERRADVMQRRTLTTLLAETAPAQALVAGIEVARAVETGTDHLARAALALRACVLEDAAP